MNTKLQISQGIRNDSFEGQQRKSELLLSFFNMSHISKANGKFLSWTGKYFIVLN